MKEEFVFLMCQFLDKMFYPASYYMAYSLFFKYFPSA